MPTRTLTPAEDGILAAAVDSARHLGLGCDDAVDLVAAVLADEGIDDERDLAYRAVHGAPVPCTAKRRRYNRERRDWRGRSYRDGGARVRDLRDRAARNADARDSAR